MKEFITLHEQKEFLAKVVAELNRAQNAHSNYLVYGKKFYFTKVLRESNANLRFLLLNFSHLLPYEYLNDAYALINHLDAWIVLWDEFQKELNPKFDEVFVFENDVNFPRKESERIVELFEKLQNENIEQ